MIGIKVILWSAFILMISNIIYLGLIRQFMRAADKEDLFYDEEGNFIGERRTKKPLKKL